MAAVHEERYGRIMEHFISTFLEGEALKSMILYMCNACTVEINDPITHTLCTFLTTPVSLCVTKTGLAPLKDCNMAIYPFGCMTPAQKAFLIEVINDMQGQGLATLSTQMGGGGMAQLNYHGPKRYLPAVDILTQFCTAVRESGGHLSEEIKDNVCNIVIQRVCSMVHVPRSSLAAISHALYPEKKCRQDSRDGGGSSENQDGDGSELGSDHVSMHGNGSDNESEGNSETGRSAKEEEGEGAEVV